MIEVLKPGIYSTIQDRGRFGFRNQGVPVSGFMDAISAGFANALLNNDSNAAMLEITLAGPKLLFKNSTRIALTGAVMSPRINDDPISNYKVYSVLAGDVVSFGELKKGLRCYLAVQGGIDTRVVLNSKSFYEDITDQKCLKKDDLIPFHLVTGEIESNVATIKNKKQFYETDQLDVYEGPDLRLFSVTDKNEIINKKYSISKDNNRMGYQLEEQSLVHDKNIITGPVLPGTVQLTPSGKLIILLKDAQTTGGYPRVLQLSEKSISILSQKNVGDKINFNLVSI